MMSLDAAALGWTYFINFNILLFYMIIYILFTVSHLEAADGCEKIGE